MVLFDYTVRIARRCIDYRGELWMKACPLHTRVVGFSAIVAAMSLTLLLLAVIPSSAMAVAHDIPGTPMGPSGANGVVDSVTNPHDVYAVHLSAGQTVVFRRNPANQIALYAPKTLTIYGTTPLYPPTWLGVSQITYTPAVSGNYFLDVIATGVGQAYTITVAGSETMPNDFTPPTTSISGVDDAWHNCPVAVTLTASDNPGGSGMSGGCAETEYALDSLDWTTGNSLSVTGSGIHTILYRSIDADGNVELAKSTTVRIDTGKPNSTATRNVTVKKGKLAKFAFEIGDPTPSCGAATVTITIKRRAKAVKTIKILHAATNQAETCSFKATLKKGSYTWSVKATDIAGNVGKVSALKKLVVR